MREIYIRKKFNKAVIWTAYSRRRSSIIAFEISNRGIESCRNIYREVKERIRKVKSFYSDGNSCYKEAFDRYMPQEKLVITKSETHLIESNNSSIRDNLARFSRRTKRYSKSWDMLEKTLEMFLNRDVLTRILGLPMYQ